MGVCLKVFQLLKLPDGTVKVLVEGEKRIKIVNLKKITIIILLVKLRKSDDQNISKELDHYALGLVKKFERLQILSKKDFDEAQTI